MIFTLWGLVSPFRYSPYTHRAVPKIKIRNCSLYVQIYHLNSVFKFFSNTVLRHYWMQKILSVYSYFFKRNRRIQGKCLCAYGEFGKFWVVSGTQNFLRIRGKNLHYAYMEKTTGDTKLWISYLIIINLIFFRFFLSTLYGIDKAWTPSHATDPLTGVVLFFKVKSSSIIAVFCRKRHKLFRIYNAAAVGEDCKSKKGLLR